MANGNVEEFWGYCCKQCALRLREEQHGIAYENPKSFQTERHGPHCQGKKLVNTDETVNTNEAVTAQNVAFIRRQLEEFSQTEEMRIATAASSSPSLPPPRLTDDQFNKLQAIQKRTGMNFDQALNVLGLEYKAESKRPPPLPIKYKSHPPQKTAIIGPFTDVETRKKYTEVITAQLLMQVPDPTQRVPIRPTQQGRASKVLGRGKED